MLFSLYTNLMFMYIGILDYILLAIPGIETITPYLSVINNTIYSIFGMLHNLAPYTFTTVATMLFFMFNTWVQLKSLKVFLAPFLWLKRMLP